MCQSNNTNDANATPNAAMATQHSDEHSFVSSTVSPPQSSLPYPSSQSPAKRYITTEDMIPTVVWTEHILPFLDRPAWNSLVEASKKIYILTALSKLTADYRNQTTILHDAERRPSLARATIQPPWPTNQPLLTKKSGGQGQAIESFCLSHDGEYLACGSVIGNIELWNLRTGKLTFRKRPGSEDKHKRHYTQYLEAPTRGDKSIVPIGNLLKFSPVGHILACGFENKIVLWNLSMAIDEHQHRSCRRNRQHGSSSNGRTTAYAQPPQPQLREYDHFLPEQKDDPSFQTTLEIQCRKGKIYQVTYLEFSKDARRLIARYGKTAYIWTRAGAHDAEAGEHSDYRLTHKITLFSSRSLMVFDPVHTRLAMATNGSNGASGDGTSSSSSRDRSYNNAYSLRDASRGNEGNNDYRAIRPGKGLVHVWDLREEEECIPMVAATITASSSQIIAYQNHVVRGLEFLGIGSSCKHEVCLVSASLQGEVKFWKKTKQQQRNQYDPSSAADTTKDYICVCRFQSPGKIFSLASWSSVSGIDTNKSSGVMSMFLAAGEARGAVRVWKILPTLSSSQPSSSSGLFLDNYEDDDDSCVIGSSDSQNYQLKECLATEVGDHVHYDNIKMLSFTPDGRSLVASRAYDAKIWFQTIRQ